MTNYSCGTTNNIVLQRNEVKRWTDLLYLVSLLILIVIPQEVLLWNSNQSKKSSIARVVARSLFKVYKPQLLCYNTNQV